MEFEGKEILPVNGRRVRSWRDSSGKWHGKVEQWEHIGYQTLWMASAKSEEEVTNACLRWVAKTDERRIRNAEREARRKASEKIIDLA